MNSNLENISNNKTDSDREGLSAPAHAVLNMWPAWKRDTLLSIFNLTTTKPEEDRSSIVDSSNISK